MHTFFLLLWGTCTLASIIGAIIVVILHNRHLRQDMQLRDEGIYITRVPRREAFISLLTPTLPAGFFAFYLYTQAELGILFNLLMFILLLVFLYHLLHVHLVYTKITPDTVEQKLSPFATVTPYPIRAIDQVFYFQGTAEAEDWDGEATDSATFYTKKGKEIAKLDPVGRNHRLLAIVRFRLEFERWPDLRDSQDLAYVDTWDSLEWTRPLFRKLYRRRNKITGLADIKM